MSTEFDPYRKWLGIPPKDQPPHYYRLLGIARFEDDADVIENAADRQMAHVRTFQAGQFGALTQQVLNELSAAKICLLDPVRKAAYDDQLRATLKAPATPTLAKSPAPPAAALPPGPGGMPRPAAVGPATPAPTATPAAAPVATGVGSPAVSPVRVRTRPRRRSSPLPLVIVMACVALILLVVAVQIISNSSPRGGNGNDVATPKQPSHDVPPPEPDPPRRPQPTPDRPRPVAPQPDRPRPSEIVAPAPPIVDADPGPSIELPPTQSARQALSRRDLTTARSLLDQAQQGPFYAEHGEQVDRTSTLFDYTWRFWQGVRQGVRSLDAETALAWDSGEAAFVQAADEHVVLRINGQRQQFAIADLPAAALVDLARRGLPADQPRSKLYVATFLALDDRGDVLANQRQAQQLWSEAAAAGVRNAILADELQLDESTLPMPQPTPDDFDPDDFRADDALATEFELQTPFVPPDQGIAENDFREAVPDDSELGIARGRMARIYGRQIVRAQTPDEQRELAALLQQEAQASADNAALHYVLLDRAADLAVDTASAADVERIVDALANRYRIDGPREKIDRLSKCVANANAPEAAAALMQHTLQLAEQAESQRRFGVAVELINVSLRAGRRARQPAEVRRIDDDLRRLESWRDAQLAAEQGRLALLNDPDDAAANQAVGEYLCLFCGQWSDGLPMLVRSDDTVYRKLSQRDVAAPADTAEQQELAQSYFQLAQRKRDPVAANLLLRSRTWLQRAEEGLTGLKRVEARQRLREIDELLGEAAP